MGELQTLNLVPPFSVLEIGLGIESHTKKTALITEQSFLYSQFLVVFASTIGHLLDIYGLSVAVVLHSQFSCKLRVLDGFITG